MTSLTVTLNMSLSSLSSHKYGCDLRERTFFFFFSDLTCIFHTSTTIYGAKGRPWGEVLCYINICWPAFSDLSQ